MDNHCLMIYLQLRFATKNISKDILMLIDAKRFSVITGANLRHSNIWIFFPNTRIYRK